MKIVLLAISVFLSLASTAQITKGSVFLGGDIGFGSQKKTEPGVTVTSKTTGFNFSPSIGVAVKENVIVGGMLNGSFYKYSNLNSSYSAIQNNSYGAAIFARKYFPFAKAFYVFGNASLGGNYIDYKNSNTNSTLKNTEKGFGINASLMPGISFQAKKKLFLEIALNNLIGLSYSHTKLENTDFNGAVTKGTSTTYNINTSLNGFSGLTLGLRFIIPKK